MVVAVVIAAVVVIPHQIEQETLCFHGRFAIIFIFDLGDGFWNGTLDEVGAPIREVVRARHGRIG